MNEYDRHVELISAATMPAGAPWRTWSQALVFGWAADPRRLTLLESITARPVNVRAVPR